MPSLNLPDGFDPLDASLNLERLPVEELAELRKARTGPLGGRPRRHRRIR